MAEFLVGKGAEIDQRNKIGQSVLTVAAAIQKTATLSFLLKSGANIHHHGHNGNTPVHAAAGSGGREVTRILVEARARNVSNDTGYMPAIIACCCGHHQIVEFFTYQIPSQPQGAVHCKSDLVSVTTTK